MNARVISSIHGSTLTSTELDALDTHAELCYSTSRQIQEAISNWERVAFQLRIMYMQAPMCPAWNQGVQRIYAADSFPYSANTSSNLYDNLPTHMSEGIVEHIGIDQTAAQQICAQTIEHLQQLRNAIQSLGQRLTQVTGLYSDAEQQIQRLITGSIAFATLLKPKSSIIALGMIAAANTISGSLTEGQWNPSYALTTTWMLQEGIFSGIAMRTAPTWLLAGGNEPHHGTVVNGLSSAITKLTAEFNNARYGNTLTVTQVHPQESIIATHSIDDAIINAHLPRLNGMDHGTVAIEEYRKTDGTRAWMVTIPPTDGHHDSPFSWQSNFELMSSQASHRKAADSARMVDAAMSAAGIAPNEPVAIVGHSQGGIVAATMAADFSHKYNIQHIVTAGSPIAGHPIKNHTWVTSIEMNDELVSNLDGSSNPKRSNWVTVRGYSVPPTTGYSANTNSNTPSYTRLPVRQQSVGSTPIGTEAQHTGNSRFLSHEMWYMKAAWEDAKQHDTGVLEAHQQHFSEVINGEHVTTRYYRGHIGKE